MIYKKYENFKISIFKKLKKKLYSISEQLEKPISNSDDLKVFLNDDFYNIINNIVSKYINLINNGKKANVNYNDYYHITYYYDIIIGHERLNKSVNLNVFGYYYIMIKKKLYKKNIDPGSSIPIHVYKYTSNTIKYYLQKGYTKYIIYEDSGKIINPYISKDISGSGIHHNKAPDSIILDNISYQKYFKIDEISQQTSTKSTCNICNIIKNYKSHP